MVQREQLLCPEISDSYEPRVKRAISTCRFTISPFDFRAPHNATCEALSVEPRVTAFLRQVGLQALRERASVFAGVGDEDLRWFRRWHEATGHYRSRTWRRQVTVYDVGLRPRRECSARPLGPHPKCFNSLPCAGLLKFRAAKALRFRSSSHSSLTSEHHDPPEVALRGRQLPRTRLFGSYCSTSP